MLGLAPHTVYVGEPDNPNVDRYAHVARMRTVGSPRLNPVLMPEQPAAEFETLWQLAFRGGWVRSRQPLNALRRALLFLLPEGSGGDAVLRRAAAFAARLPTWADTVVVKSVFATFALDWIVDRMQPRVLVVRRDPLEIIGSWLNIGYDGITYSVDEDPIARRLWFDRRPIPPRPEEFAACVAWSVAIITAALDEAVARHPDWRVVSHGQLSADPVGAYRELFADLGLEWSRRVEAGIKQTDRPGTGYVPRRVAKEEHGKWQTRMSGEQRDALSRVVEEVRRGWAATV